MNNIIKYSSILNWILSIYACMYASTISKSSSYGNKTFVFFSCSIIIILTILKVIYLLIKDCHKNKEKILDGIFPLLYVTFIIHFNYVDFGFDKAYGILYFIFKEHYYLGVLSLFVMFAITWIAIILKAQMLLNKCSKNPVSTKFLKKIVICILVITGCVIEIINTVYVIISGEVSKNLIVLFVVASALYWIIHFIIFLICKLRLILFMDIGDD